jgi:hypothetical protein
LKENREREKIEGKRPARGKEKENTLEENISQEVYVLWTIVEGK